MRSRRPLAAGLVIAGVLLVLAGLHLAGSGAAPRGPATTGAPDWGRTTGLPPSSDRQPSVDRTAAPLAAAGSAVPSGTELRIERLAVRAAVRPVTVTAGVLDVPRDPAVLGWWSGGARPGEATGSVVLDGHVNYAGVSGALAVLPRLGPGEPLVLLTGGIRYRYTVTAERTFPKATGLPADLFSRAGPPRLVLITCGGPFDTGTGNYRDNIVAYAVPSGT